MKRADTVTVLSGWKEAVQAPVIGTQPLLKAAPKPRFKTRAFDVEDADDEEDGGNDCMKRFAPSFTPQ